VSSSDFLYLDCGLGNWLSNDVRYGQNQRDPSPGMPSFNYGLAAGSLSRDFVSVPLLLSNLSFRDLGASLASPRSLPSLLLLESTLEPFLPRGCLISIAFADNTPPRDGGGGGGAGARDDKGRYRRQRLLRHGAAPLESWATTQASWHYLAAICFNSP
jgi:hypothetical protein